MTTALIQNGQRWKGQRHLFDVEMFDHTVLF